MLRYENFVRISLLSQTIYSPSSTKFFLDLFNLTLFVWGTRWRSWLRHCATSRKVAGSIPDDVTGIFLWHNPSRPHYGPGVDSASNRNEYQEYFLGGKGGVPIVLKSGSLSLLEHSGSVQACNGIALSFNIICVAIQVAARSKAWVCGRSLAGIVGSNSTWGMDDCLLYVLCVVR